VLRADFVGRRRLKSQAMAQIAEKRDAASGLTPNVTYELLRSLMRQRLEAKATIGIT
jgi:hypothetical protein